MSQKIIGTHGTKNSAVFSDCGTDGIYYEYFFHQAIYFYSSNIDSLIPADKRRFCRSVHSYPVISENQPNLREIKTKHSNWITSKVSNYTTTQISVKSTKSFNLWLSL